MICISFLNLMILRLLNDIMIVRCMLILTITHMCRYKEEILTYFNKILTRSTRGCWHTTSFSSKTRSLTSLYRWFFFPKWTRFF